MQISERAAEICGLDVILCGGASDAHTWNLVYVQLVLAESGHRVRNLGSCVTPDIIISECATDAPDLIVIGTINGHGRIDGVRTIEVLRHHSEVSDIPIVIGGKLDVSGEDEVHRAELEHAGFAAVFLGPDAVAGLTAFACALAGRTRAAC